jgi:hypothetical protein
MGAVFSSLLRPMSGLFNLYANGNYQRKMVKKMARVAMRMVRDNRSN